MLPLGVTIPATVPQGSETPEGLMNNPVDGSMTWEHEMDDKGDELQRDVRQFVPR
jgi:hypothetical protein